MCILHSSLCPLINRNLRLLYLSVSQVSRLKSSKKLFSKGGINQKIRNVHLPPLHVFPHGYPFPHTRPMPAKRPDMSTTYLVDLLPYTSPRTSSHINKISSKYLYALLPPKYPVSLVYSPKPEIFCSKPEVSHMSLQPGMSPSISIRKCGLGMQMWWVVIFFTSSFHLPLCQIPLLSYPATPPFPSEPAH